MATPTTIAESIEQNALGGVQSATVDGVSSTAMDIDKQIKADQYVKSQTAASRNHLGLTFRKFEPQD